MAMFSLIKIHRKSINENDLEKNKTYCFWQFSDFFGEHSKIITGNFAVIYSYGTDFMNTF